MGYLYINKCNNLGIIEHLRESTESMQEKPPAPHQRISDNEKASFVEYLMGTKKTAGPVSLSQFLDFSTFEERLSPGVVCIIKEFLEVDVKKVVKWV